MDSRKKCVPSFKRVLDVHTTTLTVGIGSTCEVKHQLSEAVQNKRFCLAPGFPLCPPVRLCKRRHDYLGLVIALSGATEHWLYLISCLSSSFQPISHQYCRLRRHNCRDAEHLQSSLSTKPFLKLQINDFSEDRLLSQALQGPS